MKNFWEALINIVWLARVVAVFVVFVDPFWAIIVSLALDSLDSIPAYKAGYTFKEYTRYDKVLDYWWYVVVLYVSLGLPFRNLMIVLFVVRTIGQVLALWSGDTKLFFLFPNVFENMFIIYVFTTKFFPGLSELFTAKYIGYPLVLAILTKLVHEYVVHQRKWFYNKRGWLPEMGKNFGR